MFKLKLEKPWTTSLSPHYRKLMALGVAVVCAGTIALGVHSMRERTRIAQLQLEKQLEAERQNVEERYQAGAQRFEDVLANLRLEIRAQGIWNQYGLRPDPASDSQPIESAANAPTDRVVTSAATQLRRLDRLLSQRISEIPNAQRLELIVASHDGLWARQFARTANAPESQIAATPTSLPESVARELWFETGIQSAVAGSGRVVDWGAVGGEDVAGAEPPPREQRVAIAVHDRDDVVQGALVLVIDLAAWAGQLERSSNDLVTVRLMDPSGRALTPGGASNLEENVSARRSVEAVLHPLSHPDALATARIFSAGPSDHALAVSLLPQVAGLLLVGVLGSIWAFRIAFPSDRVIRYEMAEREDSKPVQPAREDSIETAPATPETQGDAQVDAQPHEGPERLTPASQTIVLRDWLADVRTCLERKAATQGLGLEVACEHALPENVETDPVLLGAILVAVGQNALAATPNEKIRLIVRSDGVRKDALRFEIDAGGIDLLLDSQAESLLAELGGYRELSNASDFSVVVDG